MSTPAAMRFRTPDPPLFCPFLPGVMSDEMVSGSHTPRGMWMAPTRNFGAFEYPLAIDQQSSLSSGMPPPALSATDIPVTCDSVTISVGSGGHPLACGKACKYIRRKNGCRNGLDCPDCHLCIWRRVDRTLIPDLVQKDADSTFSMGSVGHPQHCGMPCKYFRRKHSCRMGKDCSRCHECKWQRAMEHQVEFPFREQQQHQQPQEQKGRKGISDPNAEKTQLANRELQDFDVFPTLGSIGHPFTCAGVGCNCSNMTMETFKNAFFCKYCHLCTHSPEL